MNFNRITSNLLELTSTISVNLKCMPFSEVQ